MSISVKKLKLEKVKNEREFALAKDLKQTQSDWTEKLTVIVDKLGKLIKK